VDHINSFFSNHPNTTFLRFCALRFIIRRLVNVDNVLVTIQEAPEGSTSNDERILRVHPNYDPDNVEPRERLEEPAKKKAAREEATANARRERLETARKARSEAAKQKKKSKKRPRSDGDDE
jgi:hypothetical protein